MDARFITFEGLDGSGKSTQLRLVTEWLNGICLSPLVTHEPGGTALGEAIRGLFLDPRWSSMDGIVETLLVFASRRQHMLEVIQPALAAGRVVLCDRFTDSTVAYQGWGGGAAMETIEAVQRQATGGFEPDLTLFFDLPPEMARERRRGSSHKPVDSADRFDAEELEFYRRVREGYLDLRRSHPRRFRLIDSSGSKEETADQVKSVLADFLGVAS